MKLTKEYIYRSFAKYKKQARHELAKRDYNQCLRFITAAAHTAYNFYLGFKDDEIEAILQELSKKITFNKRNYIKNEDVYTIFDSFSLDNGGLVQQYIDAVICAGKQLVFISERPDFIESNCQIYKTVNQYAKSKVYCVSPAMTPVQKAAFIYDAIVCNGTSKLFIHTNPSAVSAVTALYALPNDIERFKINLTDHAFWIGTRCFDYSLEFRSYGAKVSNERRGIPLESIFLLPFYPIMKHSSFLGFPEQVVGKKIILSGGAYYKIYDTNDTFFKMSKSLLDACPESIILFAGTGDLDSLERKLTQYGISDRFLPIGQRSDITEVFEHCDVYLNTYPFGGGLMCQYAAQLGKPIVSYVTDTTSKVEEFVCQNRDVEISSYSLEDLVNKVVRIFNDSEYRDEYCKQIASAVIIPSLFREAFAKTIKNHQNCFQYKESHEISELSIDDKIKYDNAEKFYQRRICKIFGLASIWICPQMLVDSLCVAINNNKVNTIVNKYIIRK